MKSKSIQDILNAFREFYDQDIRGVIEPLDKGVVGELSRSNVIYLCLSDWLLNALTEFEREIVAKVDNIMDEEKAKDMGDQMEAFTGQRSCKMCGFNPEHQRKYILRQLEKEKRT